MPLRLRVRRRSRQGEHILKFEGEVDGSTACHALDVLARTPPDGSEIVLDLSALTVVESFGLEVLCRGIRQLGRERRMRILSTPQLLPVLDMLAESLRMGHAA